MTFSSEEDILRNASVGFFFFHTMEVVFLIGEELSC